MKISEVIATKLLIKYDDKAISGVQIMSLEWDGDLYYPTLHLEINDFDNKWEISYAHNLHTKVSFVSYGGDKVGGIIEAGMKAKGDFIFVSLKVILNSGSLWSVEVIE